MREEKRWLRHENVFSHFSLLAANFINNPVVKVSPPRHALSLQTRSVGVQKGCFCLFSLCSEGVDEKNVKSSIFRKKTSKFLSSLPFKS